MPYTPQDSLPFPKRDYAAEDQKRGADLLTAFISWVNADDEDSVTIDRGSGCYMRDEIERLRKVAVGK